MKDLLWGRIRPSHMYYILSDTYPVRSYKFEWYLFSIFINDICSLLPMYLKGFLHNPFSCHAYIHVFWIFPISSNALFLNFSSPFPLYLSHLPSHLQFNIPSPPPLLCLSPPPSSVFFPSWLLAHDWHHLSPLPSEIYCHGSLLHTVQMANIHNDSKYFVDMTLKHPPNVTLAAFHDLMNRTDNTPAKEEVRNATSLSGREKDWWLQGRNEALNREKWL